MPKPLAARLTKAVRPPTTLQELKRVLDPIQTEDDVAQPVIDAIRHQAAACLLIGKANPLGEWIQNLANERAQWRNTDFFARLLSTDSIGNLGEPLRIACIGNQCAIIRMILATGRCLAIDLTEGLSAATEKGNIEAARILFATGVTNISRALDLAISLGRIELAKLLLAQPSAAERVTRMMAFGAAARNGAIEILQEMLKMGTPIDEPTPVRSALGLCRDLDCCRFLLDAGANPNARGQHGSTPLHGCHTPAILRLLIGHGAEIDARDDSGMTPLHHAYNNGHQSAARVLIDAGASLTVVDHSGKTPREYLAPSREPDWSDMP